MKLVRFSGGLGNQMRQYYFMRDIERTTGEECVIEDVSLYNPQAPKKGLEVEQVFNIKRKRLSDIFDEEIMLELKKMCFSKEYENNRKNIIQLMKSADMDFYPVQEGNFFCEERKYEGNIYNAQYGGFCPEVANFKGNTYYYGYWSHGRWFYEISDLIYDEFVFPEIKDERNIKYKKEIEEAGQKSVSLHIRRGDYVDIGWDLPLKAYIGSVSMMKRGFKDPVFFVFSDDIKYVSQHINEMGLDENDKIVFVEGNNEPLTNYIDMQLMSMCHVNIIANSSFSLNATLMNQNKARLSLDAQGHVMEISLKDRVH